MDCVGWRFTQGGGRSGLALGYYQAAPLGLLPSPGYGTASRKGEPVALAVCLRVGVTLALTIFLFAPSAPRRSCTEAVRGAERVAAGESGK